jgi:hypothetical protein
MGEACLLPQRQFDARLIVDVANNFIIDATAKEYILLDGESTRISMDLRYGIARGFEGGVGIPYIILSGGIFDYFNQFRV